MDGEKISNENIALENKFSEYKSSWNEKMEEIISKLKYFDTLADVQVMQLSYRHNTVDYVSSLQNLLIKSKSLYEKNKKDIFINLKTKTNLKLNTTETTNVLNSEIRLIKDRIEIIENQIYYAQEMIKTLDNIGYAIKNRLEIYKFQSGE